MAISNFIAALTFHPATKQEVRAEMGSVSWSKVHVCFGLIADVRSARKPARQVSQGRVCARSARAAVRGCMRLCCVNRILVARAMLAVVSRNHYRSDQH